MGFRASWEVPDLIPSWMNLGKKVFYVQVTLYYAVTLHKHSFIIEYGPPHKIGIWFIRFQEQFGTLGNAGFLTMFFNFLIDIVTNTS